MTTVCGAYTTYGSDGKKIIRLATNAEMLYSTYPTEARHGAELSAGTPNKLLCE